MDVTPEELQFEDELHWCIQKLELRLCTRNMSRREAEQSVKCLKVLKNKSSPFIQKRQAMRQALGDYRKTMAQEAKNYKLDQNFKLTEVKDCHRHGKLIKVHKPHTASGECTFKFNFPTPESNEEKVKLKE